MLVQTVVPVAGLLAETAATLTEDEFRALRQLGALPPAALDALLLTVDRFRSEPGGLALTDLERDALLARFGVFGLRLAATLLRRDPDATATWLARELGRRSGIVELKDVLGTLFADRADVLKARSALMAVEEVLAGYPLETAGHIERAVERVVAGAHALTELRVLGELRGGLVQGRHDTLAELDRVLGGEGTSPAARLGLGEGATVDELRRHALGAIDRWRRQAENPLSDAALVTAAQVAVRTCEGLLVDVAGA
jgi:CBS domain-containing protein